MSLSCRMGCGACCIAPSISSPIPGMPQGKPAGVRCVQLTDDNRCAIFGQPERPKVGSRAFVQAAQPLDAVDLGGHVIQDGRLVAAAGADLEHATQLVLRLAGQRGCAQQELDHAGHHARLGDGLSEPDRQARVLVRLVDQRAVDKAMPLDSAHRAQHARI